MTLAVTVFTNDPELNLDDEETRAIVFEALEARFRQSVASAVVVQRPTLTWCPIILQDV